MKKVIMFIAMFFIAAIGTTKAQDAAMVAEIKKSLELQHTREVMVETMKLQYETLNNSGQVAFDDVKAMSEEIVDALMPKLVEMYTKFYAENYTLAEIKELNQFLSTPLGQKNIRLTPALSQLAVKATQDTDFLGAMNGIITKHVKR
ncbi:MAG: DUF2059 domain-containing protein [Bacteroidales bacterium]|jgi:hypothetical protein|nr:DUF2059 domain-containing protein [Bacteroidales bacterium]MBR4327538.1 DUF2059 domain-containing protein [Bacteroidales bacterium]